MKRILSLMLVFICCNIVIAQTPYIDSLKNELRIVESDTGKINLLNLLSRSLKALDPTKAKQCANEALNFSRKFNFKKGIANSYFSLAVINDEQGDYPASLENHFLALSVREEMRDKPAIALSFHAIGNEYYFQGNYPKALESYLKSLKIREELQDKRGMASAYNNIGNVYWSRDNIDKALEFYFKGLKISEELKDYLGVAQTISNIGVIYQNKGDLSKALEYYFKSLDVTIKLRDTLSISNAYTNIGLVYQYQKNYAEALKYHKKCLALLDKMNNNDGVATVLINIGSCYIDLKQYQEAENILMRSLELTKKIGSKNGIKHTYEYLASLFEKKKDFEKSLDYYQLYSRMKDTLLNEESMKQVSELSTIYETEKKEKELLIKQAEIDRGKTFYYFLIGVIGLILILAFVLFAAYRSKKAASELLSMHNREITLQKNIIEEKNKDILDSIKYAKRIQDAILPSDNIINEHLPENFILYKPKDIVSGDFYWLERKDDKILLAAVDCTGHGVPGAFMSIIGHNGLNKAVKEHDLTVPSEVLNFLNQNINETLKQTYEESSVRDGMDIALCTFDFKNNTADFAGANNSLLMIRDNNIIEVKADKHPVGRFVGEALKPFTNNSTQLQSGDVLYIFTDGYADQFGGPKGKKFKYSELKKLLLSIHQLSLSEQKNILDRSFETWRGDLEQVDDVCIIGVKV